MVRISLALVTALTLCAQNKLTGIDDAVAAAMKQWQVPGLALAVVHNGQVIHSRGYGFRDVDRKLPVTPDTLFAIGSITKSMTVLGLASLADEGKLQWDKPVRDYMPDFRLHDPIASEHATAIDLLSHRTGLPRHDAMWSTGINRSEIFARLRYLQPNREFREAFQYNNLMYLAAGVLAERVSGDSWERLVRARVLDPLGMKRANFSAAETQKTADFAQTYALENGVLKAVPLPVSQETICPAGCVIAPLTEMTAYLRAHMNRGGRGLPSTAQFDRMRAPQTITPAGSIGPEAMGEGTYGMGLMTLPHRGHKVIFHTGTIGGYHALLAFLPDENAGVMILQNRVARPVPQVLSRVIWDRLLGLPTEDWQAIFLKDDQAAEAKAAAERKTIAATRIAGTQPSHPLADYAGSFSHPAYGTVRIEARETGLRWSYAGSSLTLRHFHYDTFARANNARVQFLASLDGAIDRVEVKLEPAAPPIVFKREKK